jgi:hypothetical protein
MKSLECSQRRELGSRGMKDKECEISGAGKEQLRLRVSLGRQHESGFNVLRRRQNLTMGKGCVNAVIGCGCDH